MAEGKIYKAIVNTMKDIGVVGKGDSNDFDHYKYRGIDAVMNALNPAMIKNGIFVVPTVLDTTREERQGKSQVMMYTVLTVKYTFYADDGSSIDVVVVGEAMDRSDKSTNKAMSAAFKYACFQTFCIPTEEMIDSESESPEMVAKVDNNKAKKTTTKSNAKADDEVKNEQMRASANDPYKLPEIAGGAPVAEKREKFMQEIKRTGYKPGPIFAMFNCKTLDEMSDEQLVRALERFEAIASKEEVLAKKGQ